MSCPACGKPSASPPAEVYCVECATTSKDTRKWTLTTMGGEAILASPMIEPSDPAQGLRYGEIVEVVPEAALAAAEAEIARLTADNSELLNRTARLMWEKQELLDTVNRET